MGNTYDCANCSIASSHGVLKDGLTTAGYCSWLDFNVLPFYRRLGVGSKLLQTAETEAFNKKNVVGLGVGLYGGENGEGYGAAQQFYVKRGYIPDGKGITYQNKYLDYGQNIILDDDLILWFLRKNDKS